MVVNRRYSTITFCNITRLKLFRYYFHYRDRPLFTRVPIYIFRVYYANTDHSVLANLPVCSWRGVGAQSAN